MKTESVSIAGLSLATVSISSSALASLSLTRAVTLKETKSAVDGAVVYKNHGYELDRETIFVPLTEEEVAQVEDYREQAERYRKMGKLEQVELFEKLATEAARRNLHDDVVAELIAEPVYDDKGNLVETGGPLSRRLDVSYTFTVAGDRKVKSLLTKDGKISSFIRQKAALAPQVEQVIENRRKRYQNNKALKESTAVLASHDNVNLHDAPEYLEFKLDGDGDSTAVMNLPLEIRKFGKTMTEVAKLANLNASDRIALTG